MESSDADEFPAELEIRHCLSMAREVLMDDERAPDERAILADTWMHLAESWSERAADLYMLEEIEEELEEEIELPPVRTGRKK